MSDAASDFNTKFWAGYGPVACGSGFSSRSQVLMSHSYGLSDGNGLGFGHFYRASIYGDGQGQYIYEASHWCGTFQGGGGILFTDQNRP